MNFPGVFSTADEIDCSIELSIVIPTFNEIDNVEPMIEKLRNALSGISWEAIFVDDNSSDDTADKVRQLSRNHSNIRCIQRIGRRGLSTACIEGALSSSARYIAVMDADMQHDETKLPEMLDIMRQDQVDVVVGSRYVDGGSVGEWSEDRARMSMLSTKIARLATKVDVADPMSGFFITRGDIWRSHAPRLSGIGFKILLDLLASSLKPLRLAEVPYKFRTRQFGESKLDSVAIWDFVMLILDKKFGAYVPVRFLSFAFVGGLGVFVHLATLALISTLGLSFLVSHSIATLTSMTSNFFLNNILTYRDKRLKGKQLITGWLSFSASCSIGAIANIGIGSWINYNFQYWSVAALAGIVVGITWNYVVTRSFTWRD